MGDQNLTVITTVFAPDEEAADVAMRSMANTREHFPDVERIAAVDRATDWLRGSLRDGGWRILDLGPGEPPRMIPLLQKAVEESSRDFVWTIEMDAFIQPGAREIAERVITSDPLVAAVECNALNHRGRLTEPTHGRALRAALWHGDPHVRDCTGVSFNCTVWRRAALDDVRWHQLPALIKADTPLCRQLRAAGWTLLLACDARVYHVRRVSCEALKRWRADRARQFVA